MGEGDVGDLIGDEAVAAEERLARWPLGSKRTRPLAVATSIVCRVGSGRMRLMQKMRSSSTWRADGSPVRCEDVYAPVEVADPEMAVGGEAERGDVAVGERGGCGGEDRLPLAGAFAAA